MLAQDFDDFEYYVNYPQIQVNFTHFISTMPECGPIKYAIINPPSLNE